MARSRGVQPFVYLYKGLTTHPKLELYGRQQLSAHNFLQIFPIDPLFVLLILFIPVHFYIRDTKDAIISFG